MRQPNSMVGELSRRRTDFRYAHRLLDVRRLRIELLDEQTAVHADILVRHCIGARHIDFEQTQVLLRCEDLQRLRRERRRDDDFEEYRLHHLGDLARKFAVHRHDTSVDAHLVGFVGTRPRLLDVLADGCAARIHVFQTDAERLVELADDVQRRIGILNIVVRQLLPPNCSANASENGDGLPSR